MANWEVLKNKKIIRMIIGDENIKEEIITDTKMPHMSGADICNLGYSLGMIELNSAVNNLGRIDSMNEVIDYVIEKDIINDFFKKILELKRFRNEKNYLYRDPGELYFHYKYDFLEAINKELYFDKCRIEYNFEKWVFNLKDYDDDSITLLSEKNMNKRNKVKNDSIEKILNILNRFHLVTKQLKDRHDSRDTLIISDEYDVQDLIHSLLRLYFDDIRAEEWTPSYAGSCSRQDFLLKKEKIVIEIKKTRKGLADKKVGEELIIDIDKYKSHSDCKTLICFVYDPDSLISNPKGLENDLTKQSDGLNIITLINQQQ